jgi:hypothetical protein
MFGSRCLELDDGVKNLQRVWLEFVEKDYYLATYHWLCRAAKVLHLFSVFSLSIYGGV